MNKNIFCLFALIMLITVIPQFSNINSSLPEGVSIFMLDNGMKVLVIENPALPMVGVNVVVKIGSAYENFASSGMSHMLEHLLFNGTATRTQKQLYDETDMIGGYNNANTSEFYTNFMMVTPAENIEKGMEIQADMLFNSTLPEKKFEKEKGIVLEEISKSLADPREQKERNKISVLFKGHALSLPTLGTYSTIKHMNRDEVYSFYKRNYVPNNMILSVVGNFDTAGMIRKINKIYGTAAAGNISGKKFPDFRTGFEPLKSSNSEGKIFHRFYSGKDTILGRFYAVDKQLFPAHIKVLGFILSEREKTLRDLLKKKFPDTVKDVSMNLISNPVKSFIEVEIRLKSADKTDDLSAFLNNRIENLSFEIKDDQLKESISKERTNFLKNIEKPHMFGIFNAYNFAVYGIESVLSSYRGETFVNASEELKSLKPNGIPTTIFQHPSLKKKVVNKNSGKAVLIRDEKRGKSLIVERNKNSNLLALHFIFKHKAPFEEKFGKGSAEILHYCFEKRLKTEENLKSSQTFGLSVKVNDNPFFPMDDIYMNPDFGYIRVEGLSEYTDEIILFLKNNLKNYVPTKDEFNYASQKVMRYKMMKMGRGKSAKSVFNRIIDETVYNGIPTGKPGVTFENLIKFGKEYFSPSNTIVSIVSPIEVKKIDEMFDDFFTLGSKEEPAPAIKTYKLPENKIFKTEKGDGNRDYLFWGFVKNIDKRDTPAIKALSLALSDIITFDIREKRGMAYGMSSGVTTIDGRSLFFIKMGTMPKNSKKLISIFPKFFNVKTVSSLTKKSLKRLINKYLGRMMFRRLSSINRAYYLGYSLYFYKDIYKDSESLEKLKKITVEDVKRVAEKYLKIEKPILITVR